MVTIYDVAQLCGVSIATVSRALNNHQDVNERTKERVFLACKELNYQPTAHARGLTLRRSWSVGVFYRNDLTNPFFNTVLTSFKGVFEEANYELFFFNSDEGLESAISRAQFRKVDGIVFCGLHRTERHLDSIVQSGIPCVSINFDLSGKNVSYVESDNYGGTMKAMQYLIENGHKKIGFIGEREMLTKSGYDRNRAFLDSMSKYQLEVRDEWRINGGFTEVSGYGSARQLLRFNETPTAVICIGDMVAIGAMRAFKDAGMCIGRDISVLGYDDISLAQYTIPRLTTVRQQTHKLGEIAARHLIQLMNGKPAPDPVVLRTELIVRESVGRVSHEDERT